MAAAADAVVDQVDAEPARFLAMTSYFNRASLSFPMRLPSRRRLLSSAVVAGMSLAVAGCTSQKEFPEYTAYTLNTEGKKGELRGSYRRLAEEIHRLRQETAGDDISLSVYNYSDQTTFIFTPDFRGCEASTVKVPIALTAMRRAFAEGTVLSEELREAVKASISFSDNNATSTIFASLADADDDARSAEINKTYDLLNITQTRADSGWGANLTGSEDHLKIQRAVYEGVSWAAMDDMQILREAMRVTDPASQGWGVGVLAKLVGAGADTTDMDTAQQVLCKNGWLPDDLAKWYINSDGFALYADKTFAFSVMLNGFEERAEGQHVASRVIEATIKNLAL